ncbi:MAG: pirin family protein [Pseudomonadota bacterium]
MSHIQHRAYSSPDALIPAEALHLRAAEDRGHADHGWLKSAHSFSFSSYYDPDHMNFEALRVINDDRVAGGGGFPMHPHQDFEIFSYVLEGAIAHKDSLGNGSTVSAGGVQYMTTGRGVQHSEYNPHADQDLRFLQIWLMPKVRGADPRYDQIDLSPQEKDGQLKLFISEDGREGSIPTLAPADIYAGTFDGAQQAEFTFRRNRKGWVQIARGSIKVNGVHLKEGDGLAITAPGQIHIEEGQKAELLLFDLATL